MATVMLGLVVAGCGTQTGVESSSEPATSAPATTDDPEFVTADCPSHQSSGGTIDLIPPSTRREAAAWAQSPYEAARDTQTAPAFEDTLGAGELTEVSSSRGKAVYSVVQDGRQIGLLTVRPIGFGAFATEQIEACSPTG